MTEREKKEIQMCLTCPLPECINCLEAVNGGKSLKHVRGLQEVQRMVGLGYDDKRMAKELGVHPNTVLLFRKELGIPNYIVRRAAARRA